MSSALQKAAAGLGNVRDPHGGDRVYCVRCFVWRDAEGHHCSECQRCTSDFDHHCGVLGCCVGGRGFRGNAVATVKRDVLRKLLHCDVDDFVTLNHEKMGVGAQPGMI